MRQIFLLEATGANLAVILNTDVLAQLFGTRDRAVNINSITVTPLVLGSAVEYGFYADKQYKVDEETDATPNVFPPGELNMNSLLLGSTGVFTNASIPGYKTVFHFSTVDVSPQTHGFTLFPIYNNLIIGWDADIDALIEIDFTRLDKGWNWREEIMRLLQNKRQVENPNISNVDGKRGLVRNPLRLTGG